MSETAGVAPDGVTKDFKLAMRRLAATVTIVTAWHEGRRFGMAATAVNSVTTSPPTLLACINRSASIHAPISHDGRFCVNLLGHDHETLVPPFSGQASGEERFAFGAWQQGDDAPPFLVDAQASLLCRVADSMTYGSHTIFIGEVQVVHLSGEPRALVYHDGQLLRTGDRALSERS